MPEIKSLKFTDEQKRIWKASFAPTATPDQWALFIDECERRALIPNTHVVFSLRNASEPDPISGQWIKVKKVAFITTINALRLLVDRYSDAHPDRAFKGYGKFKFYYGAADGEGLIERDIPSSSIPHAVSVTVKRKDWDDPLFVSLRYDAAVQLKRDGGPTDMWAKRGPEQLAKCCEAFALRAIAPEELGGLYLKEELEASLDQAEVPAQPAPAFVPAPLPQPAIAPPVNQAPATETVETRLAFGQPAIKPATEAGSLFANSERPAPENETSMFPPAVPKASIPSAPVITDSDLPGMFFEAPAPKAAPAPAPIETPKSAPPPVATQPAPVSAPSPTPAPAATDGSKPATAAERNSINPRIARIVRDTLPKGGVPEKQAGELVKAYFTRNAGVAYTAIPFSKLTELIVALETQPTPEDTAKLVKG